MDKVRIYERKIIDLKERLAGITDKETIKSYKKLIKAWEILLIKLKEEEKA